MNKPNFCKYLTVGVFISVAVAASVAGRVAEGRANAVGSHAVPPAGSDVKSLFKKNCARCHGADGSADTESGRLYETPDISGGKLKNASSAKLVKIVANGKESMPAFRKKLTSGQIDALVTYMKSL